MNDTKPPRTQRGKTIFMVRSAPKEHECLIGNSTLDVRCKTFIDLLF